jgi:hypothetical protein
MERAPCGCTCVIAHLTHSRAAPGKLGKNERNEFRVQPGSLRLFCYGCDWPKPSILNRRWRSFHERRRAIEMAYGPRAHVAAQAPLNRPG